MILSVRDLEPADIAYCAVRHIYGGWMDFTCVSPFPRNRLDIPSICTSYSHQQAPLPLTP